MSAARHLINASMRELRIENRVPPKRKKLSRIVPILRCSLVDA